MAANELETEGRTIPSRPIGATVRDDQASGVTQASPGAPSADATQASGVAEVGDATLPPHSSVGVVRSSPAPSTRFAEGDEIGRGGMGSVHRVHDATLLRTVAMKKLDPLLAEMPSRVHGFVEEAQIQAQLDHPNVVPIHELGVDSTGTLYFTMKLVRGSSLTAWLADPARPVGSADRLGDGLDVFLKACDAVAFAHSRGVVHRDLKPDNVMVGEFGEVYVMDWGIARVIGDEVRLSRSGEELGLPFGPVGTPAYMSPEAANGLHDQTDARTDVFGLGTVLYAIVTGAAPYHGDDVDALLRAARRGAYVPVEEAAGNVAVPKRLARILEKALARERDDRHQSVAELRAEVHQFMRGGLHLPRVSFPAGARIVIEGELGDTAYIVVTGECEAYKTSNGQRLVLRRMGAGEVFGETGVISELPRTASVDAVTPVTALVISRAALEEGLGLDTWLGTLVKALALRFRELDQRLHGG